VIFGSIFYNSIHVTPKLILLEPNRWLFWEYLYKED